MSVAGRRAFKRTRGLGIKSARHCALPFELRREPPNKHDRGVGANLYRKRRSASKLRALGGVWRGRGRRRLLRSGVWARL